MEMTTALLALTAAGRGDHWDTVDRWFRNTVVECQFRDPAALNRGYAPGEPKPWDDTRDIVNRSLGGFFWASPYEYLCWRIRLMTCCSGHAIWTLGKIADHAVMDEGPAGGISVNLHYTLETPLAAVSCHEPFAGRLEVVPARTGPVRIRVPSFATGVTVSLDGAEVPHAIRDGYVALDRVPAGAQLTLDYPLPERHGDQVVRIPQAAEGGTGAYFGPKADPIVGHRIPTRWRGNTVMAIDYADGRSRRPLEGVPGPAPQQPRHRLFATREARFATGAGRDDPLACFLPDHAWAW